MSRPSSRRRPRAGGRRATSKTRLARLVEAVEGDAWAELQLAIAPDLRERAGIEVRRYGSAVALLARHIDVPTINRVLGLGFDTPLSADLLDSIIADYRDAGVPRFVLQWSPEAKPGDASGWFDARGFRQLPPLLKLCRSTELNGSLPTLPTHLRVDEIDLTEAETFERTVANLLGVPGELTPAIRSTVGHPGWRFYLVREGDRALAGAALYARGDMAWCGLAATLPADRQQGAQTLLLTRRISDAAAMGCRWISCDTREDTAARPNPSYRNMLRLGFEVMYRRPNFVLDLSRLGS